MDQFEEVSKTLAAQKEEFEEKLSKSTTKFAQKPIEKQYEVNTKLLARNNKIQKALKKKLKQISDDIEDFVRNEFSEARAASPGDCDAQGANLD